MTKWTAVLIVAGVATIGCARTAMPTSPTMTAPSTGGSLNRVVDGIGVDIPECVGCPEANLVISTQSGQRFVIDGFLKRDSETVTTAYGFRIPVPETDKSPRVAVLRVTSTDATISLWLSGQQTDSYYETIGTAVPTITAVADATCPSGNRLVTRLSVLLQHLGRSTIEERHCAE